MGILLVFIGALFLLYNLQIINLNMFLFILSLGVLVSYFIGGNIVFLILGLVGLGGSVIYTLNEYAFPNVNIKGFLILSIFSILAFVLFKKQRNRLFLVGSLIFASFSIYSLIRELSYGNVFWSLILLFGIAFFIYYLIGYRELGIVWPRNIGYGLVIVSFVVFVVSRISMKITFWTFISYLWPLALIAIGLKILYNIMKNRY